MYMTYKARNIRFLKFTKLELLDMKALIASSRKGSNKSLLKGWPNDDVFFFSMNLLVFLVYVCPRCGGVCVGDYGRWVRGGGPG